MIMNKLLVFIIALYSSITFSESWIDNAKVTITENNLTSIELSCIDFDESVMNDGKVILVTTFEIHSDTCPGDPKTRPKLFFIEFDLGDGTIKSNAKSEVGQMELIEKIR